MASSASSAVGVAALVSLDEFVVHLRCPLATYSDGKGTRYGDHQVANHSFRASLIQASMASYSASPNLPCAPIAARSILRVESFAADSEEYPSDRERAMIPCRPSACSSQCHFPSFLKKLKHGTVGISCPLPVGHALERIPFPEPGGGRRAGSRSHSLPPFPPPSFVARSRAAFSASLTRWIPTTECQNPASALAPSPGLEFGCFRSAYRRIWDVDLPSVCVETRPFQGWRIHRRFVFSVNRFPEQGRQVTPTMAIGHPRAGCRRPLPRACAGHGGLGALLGLGCRFLIGFGRCRGRGPLLESHLGCERPQLGRHGDVAFWLNGAARRGDGEAVFALRLERCLLREPRLRASERIERLLLTLNPAR